MDMVFFKSLKLVVYVELAPTNSPTTTRTRTVSCLREREREREREART